MSEWTDTVLANRMWRDCRPFLTAAVLGSPTVAASERVQPNGDIGQAADAVAGIRRALQARGLMLTGTFGAPAHQATRCADPRAYQAYVEEMVCLS